MLINASANYHQSATASSSRPLPRETDRLYQAAILIERFSMRADTERTIADIKQALALLRRHL
jgi:hypothetical protein